MLVFSFTNLLLHFLILEIIMERNAVFHRNRFLQLVLFTVTNATRGRISDARIHLTTLHFRGINHPWWLAMVVALKWFATQSHVSAICRTFAKIRIVRHSNRKSSKFFHLCELKINKNFWFLHSVWEREADLHVAATNKLIHGGPRVHDGKYRHWSHVLLWGGYVQSCLPDLVFESRTPADPVDHPCTTLGHLREPGLLCRTLQWSCRITLILLDSPPLRQWFAIHILVEF